MNELSSVRTQIKELKNKIYQLKYELDKLEQKEARLVKEQQQKYGNFYCVDIE